MAPDAAAVKAAREIAASRVWSSLGRDDEVVWGLAQGSGKAPYQVQVVLAGLACKCSCPSRKLPCKHGLGLLFLAAAEPGRLAVSEPPPWVTEWLAARTERAQRQQARSERAEHGAPTTADSAAAARRSQKKAARTEDGIALLQQWLADLVDRGFADPAVRTPAFFDEIARRMVDAQAPALGARVRTIGTILTGSRDVELRALDEVGRLHTLLRAAGERERLPDDQRHSVQQAIGWSTPADDLRAGPVVADDWFVAGRTVVEQDRLVTSTTWLAGNTTRRFACIVQTSPVHLRAGDVLPVGATLRGALTFRPGTAPMRATFATPPPAHVAAPPAWESFAALLQRHAAALAVEPWWRHTPFLAAVTSGTVDGDTVLVDADGDALPWRPRGGTVALLDALSGGRPVSAFGLFDGYTVDLLAAADADSGEWLALHVPQS